MTNIYKFMSADIADKIMMDDKHVGIKFSQLDDYNDPFEFFLTIDFNRSSAELAFYNEMIGMVLRQPATCFTKNPTISPMWAHYASNSSGFAIEINEEKLEQYIIDMGFGDISGLRDVDYMDAPSEDIEPTLARAFQISKPRYIYFLQQYIRHAAYFTKQTCWSYEQERRLIIDERALTKINDWLMLFPLPIDCITAVIVGHKANEELKSKIRGFSKKAKCSYFEIVIGKTTTSPFFLSRKLNSHQFINGRLEAVSNQCKKCNEPIEGTKKYCGWCGITAQDANMAAFRNSFRMIESAGGLEKYIAAMDAVGRRR